ncbi:MAG: hypothetical protein H8D84_00460, partial [Proteobacteria bacterium]|nr:hypothetical protein [Pseudomonadota bacterium]
MADKLLILGAAIAHANKGHNLISSSITKAVDTSLKGFNEALVAQQKRVNAAGLLTQAYLDKLPEDPEIDLLDENMISMYTTELNNIRSEIAKKRNDKYINSYKYAPGTQAYTDIETEMKKLEKKLKTRHQEAKDVQLAKSNWIKEHANISDTWMMFNADKYEALTQILNSVDPNYTAKRNIDDELILSTTIKGGKTIDINVSELDDWEEYPMPEIQKINEFYELAQNAGAQGKDLPGGTVAQIKNYLYNYIGKNKSALLSLMFDKLPIGDADNKMEFFTGDELHEMFDENNNEELSSEEMAVFGKKDTEYDFSNMRDKVISRIVEKIKLENEKAKSQITVETGFFNDKDISSTELQGRLNFTYKLDGFKILMNGLKDKSNNEILNAIKNHKSFTGHIDGVSKNSIILKESSINKAVWGMVDL